MDKLKTIVALAAFIYIPVATALLVEQEQKIKALKNNNERLRNWGTAMSGLIKEHYKNGGSFIVGPEVELDIDAYILMRENGLA